MSGDMKFELMRQMIFDCAMDLLYNDEYSKENAADYLLRIVKYADRRDENELHTND